MNERGNEFMKNKKIVLVIICLLAVAFIFACKRGGEDSKNEDEDREYAVVNMSEGTLVTDLFTFTSTTKTSISDPTGKMNIDDAVYTVGMLSNGCTVVWKSGDDGYGYDDCKFVYIVGKGSVSDCAKLNETGISYNEFLDKYGNHN